MATVTPEERHRVVEHVLAQLSTGRSIAKIFREDAEEYALGEYQRFWSWLRNDPQLEQDVGRARELGIEAKLDEVLDITDAANDDVYLSTSADGTQEAKIDGSTVARARLQAEYRLKMAQMLKPKKYGAKVDLTSDGKALAAPVVHNDNRVQTLIQTAIDRKAARAIEDQAMKDIFD